ncbi:uncharacterized protein K02A2.6-like [Wyeomyia smithii]|uniref:uncharacterized protein K02A2.6-like n=1 Tax=Wyeomyia smithii TaxID=174621 RepID=UPI00246821C2|nr:uncharacterized protein K02A2.6-like [Wyeomyia smithii]
MAQQANPQLAEGAPPPNFHIDAFDRKKIRWNRWVERLETAFAIYGIGIAELRRNFLLHLMGPDTYEIACDKVAPQSPRTMTYQAIIDVLEGHFNPQPLEISENFRFKCRKQGDKNASSPDETIDEYLTALRRIAVTCNFGNYLETALRNQLVFGMKSNDIRARLLERRQLTLADARDVAVGMELSLKGGAEIEGAYAKQEVHALHNQQGKAKHKKVGGSSQSSGKPASDLQCYRCGDKSHVAKKCRHLNTVCSYCKIKGHLERVCMKKTAANRGESSRQGSKLSTVKASHIDVREGRDAKKASSGDVIVGEICTVDSRPSDAKMWLPVNVCGVSLRFEVDTGSPVSIINTQYYDKHFRNIKLRNSDLNLVSYCNTDIQIKGVLDADVECNGTKERLPLYVVNSGKHPLLGREWLKVLAVDWSSILQTSGTVHAINPLNISNALNELFATYTRVFDDSIGKISSVQARLTLKPNATPVFLRARKVPFNLKNAIDNELDKLVTEGVLTKVDNSSWATPIVPVKKSDNRIRICGDYKQTVNPNLKVDQHPLPTVDELFASLAGGDKFSKIDLVQAYLQLEVAPEDREILTLNTHRGLYRPNRLMYGIASAPAIWQRQIEIILQGIDGVSVFLDDIKITGPNDVHLSRLEEVLRRLDQYNIRVNRAKCEFLTNKIEYCGYLIDREGIHKVQKKMDAIQFMPRPKNKDEVRSFVGFINYYGRFFDNLSTMLYPLNNLLKDTVEFKWTKECEHSFYTVKQQMQSDRCLVHYSPELPLLLATDASPYGVGAVLSHVYPDGSERPIQFASQTLNATQQKYMQVDKEAYAIIFGVKKYFQYLYGRRFILVTDNHAVTKIFSEHKGLPVMSALRMQHYATYLQSFDYEIRFRKSTDHANADAMSRIPVKLCGSENIIEESDVVEMNQIDTLPVTAEQLSQATSEDKNIQTLLQGLRYGQAVDGKDRFGIDQTEFTIQNGCLLRGIRVYVPVKLRERVLAELHSTHFGITRTKSLARGVCWWMGIDREIEELISNCAECQSIRSEPTKVLPHPWEPATEPFQRVHADFAGPFQDTYFFIMVDAYTKWPEIRVCKSITAEHTERMCREIFSRFGIPAVFVSDHGTQFTAESFQRFLKLNGITHKMGAPYHPATNGQAERYVQTFKQKLKAIRCPKSKLDVEIANILMTYRKMIHPSTGRSPSMMVFGRQIKSRLDLMLPTNSVRRPANPVNRVFLDGDKVRVRDFLSANKWQFGQVVSKLGKMRYSIRLDDGRLWERHVDHMCGVGSNLDSSSRAGSKEMAPEFATPIVTTASSGDNRSCEVQPVVGTSFTSESQAPPPVQPVANGGQQAVVSEGARMGNVEPVQPVRRSNRVVKPPCRLNL